VGRAVDTRLFGPRRTGARISDLRVQSSRYGQPPPGLFGRLRVAGSVIWATDLIEQKSTGGGTKGTPRTSTYSYSVSLAVALSARPIRSVGRIWADGKLLRGAEGDWKASTDFRLHNGSPDQAPDPLIEADLGPVATPAYRGLAYAVFEHLDLTDFGNRIPSFSFEVDCDPAPVPVHMIASDLSGGLVVGEAGVQVDGYAAAGDTMRDAIAPLAELAGLRFAAADRSLRIQSAFGPPLQLGPDDLGAGAGDEAAPKSEDVRDAAGSLPDEVRLGYADPELDFQEGLQRARLAGSGRRRETFDLPVALAADVAKQLAEAKLTRAWAERRHCRVSLPWSRLDLRPGNLVTMGGEGQKWRIREVRLEGMAVGLSLDAVAPLPAGLPHASPGAPVREQDQAHGPTVLAAFELPAGAGGNDIVAFVAAAGTSPGWRRAVLSMADADGGDVREIGRTASAAVLGTSLAVLPPARSGVFDSRFTVDVTLLHGGMDLLGCDDTALGRGGNLALLGDELIQFGEVLQLGPTTYRLGRLVRGCGGTEWAAASHVSGDRFVLIDSAMMAAHGLSSDRIGTRVQVSAAGIGDSTPASVFLPVRGLAVRPPCPVHLRARRLPDGVIRFEWTRRSRSGWAWMDGTEVPLAEETELYRLTIEPAEGDARVVSVTGPVFDYLIEMQVADETVSSPTIGWNVQQIGTLVPSMPSASMTFSG